MCILITPLSDRGEKTRSLRKHAGRVPWSSICYQNRRYLNTEGDEEFAVMQLAFGMRYRRRVVGVRAAAAVRILGLDQTTG
jgi:hypothetical protein